MAPARTEAQHGPGSRPTQNRETASFSRGSPRLFPIARLGAGPRFTLDGEYEGAWNARAGLAVLREVRRNQWWRVEMDFAYLRQEGAQGFGGGAVALYGSLPIQAGYSVRALGMFRNDLDFAIRHGLATRFLAGLLSLDLEHERFPGTGTDALVLTFSIDIAALATGIAIIAAGPGHL